MTLWYHSCFPLIGMVDSYFQLVLHRHNSWLLVHQETMADFKSVAFVHNRCTTDVHNWCAQLMLSILFWCILSVYGVRWMHPTVQINILLLFLFYCSKSAYPYTDLWSCFSSQYTQTPSRGSTNESVASTKKGLSDVGTCGLVSIVEKFPFA